MTLARTKQVGSRIGLVIALLCVAFPIGCAALFRGLAYDPSDPRTYEQQYQDYQNQIGKGN